MSFLVLVVDDEPDIEMLFRQQFRRRAFAATRSGPSGSEFWTELKQRALIESDASLPAAPA